MAFTQNTTPTCIKQPTNGKVQFTSTFVAAGVGVIYTAGANGSKISGLNGAGNTASAPIFNIGISTGGSTYYLTTFTGSTLLTAPTNVMNLIAGSLPLDSDGNPYIHLLSGDTLQFSASSSVASGTYNFVAIGGDF